MILDQGIGAHQAQVEYVGGWMWTWVSGEAAVVIPGTPKYPGAGTFTRDGFTAGFSRNGMTADFERRQ